jgi:hypothetical protein
LAKGDFHLVSPVWLNDFSEFITDNKDDITVFVKNAKNLGD